MTLFDISTPDGMAKAVSWTNRLLALIRSGGEWIIPRSLSVYRVDHESKTVTAVMGCDEEVERVLVKAGWKVERRPAAKSRAT